MMKFLLIHIKNTFYQGLKQIITILRLMVETFMINQLTIQLNNVMKLISTGQSDDYTTGCLLDYSYFRKNYRIITADLSKQKALDADSRAIQQIIFTSKIKATVANTRIVIFYVLEKSKETILEFSKGTTKVLQANKKNKK